MLVETLQLIPMLVLLMLTLAARPASSGPAGIQVADSTSSSGVESFELLESTSGCYFSAEYQGRFVMQVGGGNAIGSIRHEAGVVHAPTYDDEPVVLYSVLNITFNAVPVWGYCHKKIDDKVLLRDRQGGYNGECIRCIQLARRSRNIIEIFYEDLKSCHTNETAAIESCKHLKSSSILYRTNEIGDLPVRNEYCPIAGKYRFKYSVNEYDALEHNNAEARDECSSYSSDLDNCPDGSIFTLRFKKCSFEDHDVSFECLGSWPAGGSKTGSDAPRYVALIDSRGATNFTGPAKHRRPRYRCGLYHVDSKTAKTYLTLSSDSSCTQDLHNSTSGYESLVLSKATNQKKMPEYVINNSTLFPQWAQGEWEETLIVNGTMTFNDLNGYKSYTFVTVDSNDKTGRYIVFFRDQCEQEAYICLIMKQRSENVLEFATSLDSSPMFNPYLCNDTTLMDKTSGWLTLARLERSTESPCPITGQYEGQITDLNGMCAELSSNCHTRQIMYYKVYDCQSRELFEERTYLCLGQWEENGVTYTYTMRNETGTNECFVGTIVDEDEIYIKEAGDFCNRNVQPKTEGMRLYKNGECYGNSSSPAPTVPTKSSPRPSSVQPTTPMRPVPTKAPTAGRPRGGSATRGPTTVGSRTPTSVNSTADSLRASSCVVLTMIYWAIGFYSAVLSRRVFA